MSVPVASASLGRRPSGGGATLRSAARAASRHPLGFIGAGIVLAIVVVAAASPVIAPASPTRMSLGDRLLAPRSRSADGVRHWLGTDQLGRDVLTRIIHGARVSLIVGGVSVALAGAIGTGAGLAAGYWGGPADSVIMRLVDLQLAFPFILLAMAIVSLLGPSLPNVIIVFVVTTWPVYARVTRGSVLVVRSYQFIEAARSLGAQSLRVALKHVLPNILAPVLVVASFQMAQVVIVEAALGFLGLGVPPPTPTWGNMLADGRAYVRDAWWLSTFPGLAIMVLASGVNFLGDGLRDALDPRLRSR